MYPAAPLCLPIGLTGAPVPIQGTQKNTHRQVNVVITNSSNHILLPPNQFISDVTMKWYTIPGYNSLSPELVPSVFLNPISVPSKQVLRVWYGEDLANHKERDNGGRVCADVYSTYD